LTAISGVQIEAARSKLAIAFLIAQTGRLSTGSGTPKEPNFISGERR